MDNVDVSMLQSMIQKVLDKQTEHDTKLKQIDEKLIHINTALTVGGLAIVHLSDRVVELEQKFELKA